MKKYIRCMQGHISFLHRFNPHSLLNAFNVSFKRDGTHLTCLDENIKLFGLSDLDFNLIKGTKNRTRLNTLILDDFLGYQTHLSVKESDFSTWDQGIPISRLLYHQNWIQNFICLYY